MKSILSFNFFSKISNFVLLAVIGTLIIIFLIYLIFTFFQKKLINEKKTKNLNNKSITIDYANKLVTIFDKKHLYKAETITYDDYLNLFDSNSRKNVDDFINKHIENTLNNIETKIEVDSLLNSQKSKYYFSILEINNVNYQKELIHLSQYFFENIPLVFYLDLKKKEKVNSSFEVTDNVLNSRFINSKHYKGVSLMFNISLINFINRSNINTFAYYSIRNILSKYVKSGRIFVTADENSFVLHDFKITKHITTLKLISKIRKEFLQFIEMNSIEDRVRLNIGVVEHKYFPNDFSKTMKALKQITNEAIVKSRAYLFYDNQNRTEFYFDQSYKTEVESIINNHSLRYYFSPIINTSNYSIIGYFSTIVPVSSVFTEINEVKNYAYKLLIDKELFSEISKHLVSKFMNENQDDKEIYLFYDLKFNELSFANSLLGYISGFKRVNSVLTFNESDLLKNLNVDQKYIDIFKKLASKGYKLGLNVSFKNLELPDELYSMFDYFVYDSIYFEENFEDISHSSLFLKKSIEKVLKFKKKVIIKSVNNWSDVELRIQENLKLLSGDAILPSSEMIMPISKKTIEKIKRIKKKGN